MYDMMPMAKQGDEQGHHDVVRRSVKLHDTTLNLTRGNRHQHLQPPTHIAVAVREYSACAVLCGGLAATRMIVLPSAWQIRRGAKSSQKCLHAEYGDEFDRICNEY